MSPLGCQIKNALRNQALLTLARMWSRWANQKDVWLIITALNEIRNKPTEQHKRNRSYHAQKVPSPPGFLHQNGAIAVTSLHSLANTMCNTLTNTTLQCDLIQRNKHKVNLIFAVTSKVCLPPEWNQTCWTPPLMRTLRNITVHTGMSAVCLSWSCHKVVHSCSSLEDNKCLSLAGPTCKEIFFSFFSPHVPMFRYKSYVTPAFTQWHEDYIHTGQSLLLTELLSWINACLWGAAEPDRRIELPTL